MGDTTTSMLTLLLSLSASASSGDRPGQPPASGWVATPFGDVTAHRLQGFCTSPDIVIGTITEVESFENPGSTTELPDIASHVQFTVGATVRARHPIPESLRLVLAGGTVGDRVQPPFRDRMQPVRGTRWLMAYLPRTDARGPLKKGDPSIGAAFQLDPDLKLDATQIRTHVQRTLAEHCPSLQ